MKHPRRLSGEFSSQRLRDDFTKASRRDHYGGFMKPSFKAFVNPSDRVHIGFGIPSNRYGLLEPSRSRFVDAPFFFALTRFKGGTVMTFQITRTNTGPAEGRT